MTDEKPITGKSAEIAAGFEEELKNSDLYSGEGHWYVNAGGKTIHASRIRGLFRNLKWVAQSVYLFFFAGTWIRYNGEKAIFFDIPHRQFHLFGLTIWPQDIWILALTLILLAITLVGLTALAGRVFCGYFCFHTVWVDWYTLIEQWIEGSPGKRRKLDLEPFSLKKLFLRLAKYSAWLTIAIFTAFTFTSYFMEPVELFSSYIHFEAPFAAWASLIVATGVVFVFPGFMREQVCFWLCPYARIQSVMIDKDSVIPTYDQGRGEPRTKFSAKGKPAGAGDCIDCHSCVNVCPTGVDIRHGFQEGCITCGLCIDACDIVMKKTSRPRGLIRYSSRNQMNGQELPPVYRRPRIVVYTAIFLVAASGIIYGLSHLSPVEFAVLHDRQPLYTRMSDGSIQNKYVIKLLNKTRDQIPVKISVEGVANYSLNSQVGDEPKLEPGKMVPFNVFLKVPAETFQKGDLPIHFVVRSSGEPGIELSRKSILAGPKP